MICDTPNWLTYINLPIAPRQRWNITSFIWVRCRWWASAYRCLAAALGTKSQPSPKSESTGLTFELTHVFYLMRTTICVCSTLLQFRLNCQGCGHQASEHRKLTAVDQFIKSEVGAGRRSKCSASILPSEIPLSPIFSRYDLIPLPRDDPGYTPNMVMHSLVLGPIVKWCPVCAVRSILLMSS